MKKYLELPILIMITLVFTATMAIGKDYVIYSISQDLPMGNEKEVIRKNFYVDMGLNQGVTKGSTLDVFRIISVLDPYENKKRYNHKVKIGELSILHSEETSSIGVYLKSQPIEETPIFELSKFMIGDQVSPHTSN